MWLNSKNSFRYSDIRSLETCTSINNISYLHFLENAFRNKIPKDEKENLIYIIQSGSAYVRATKI